MSDVTFRKAPEVAVMAEAMIEGDFPLLKMHDVMIEFVFRDKPQRVRGSDCAATCTVKKGFDAWFRRTLKHPIIDPKAKPRKDGWAFFLIQIHEETWVNACPRERKATLHHELCHCGVYHDCDKDEVTLSVLPHDIERFESEVEKYGLWDEDLMSFGRVMLPYLGEIKEFDDAEKRELGGIR